MQSTPSRSVWIRASVVTLFITGLAGALGSACGVREHSFSRELQSNGPPGDVSPTSAALRKYRPALAVRGINCLMCHTQIRSNILTDFGYGDGKFFVSTNPATDYTAPHSGLRLPWYGNYYGEWQLAERIEGTVIIPRATIRDPNFLASVGQSGPIALLDLLQLDLGSTFYGPAGDAGGGPLTARITPVAGNPRIIDAGTVFIGAPDLTGLQNRLPSSVPNPGWAALGDGAQISGLTTATGEGGGRFVTHGADPIVCRGDVVINGTLFLNDVRIDTGAAGCRLYVTRSIFISGRVNYLQSGSTENLQLSSARAILLGFSPASLRTRLGAWYDDAQPLTRAPGSNSEKNGAILAEADLLGPARLKDSTDAAACPTEMRTYVGENGGGSSTTLTQCAIEYHRLLLNAPNVQSRYVGRFHGVTIAEIALFAPGALDFEYDAVFDSVDALPLLGQSILHVTE